MTRIHHPPSTSSKITLLVGLVVAVLVTIGIVWWSYSRDQKIAPKTHPDEFPVPSDAELRHKLNPEQFHVTRENGTETAFHNQHWDNHKPGLYVDIITNEPLFSSLDKYDPALASPVSQNQSGPSTSWKRSTTVTTWCGPKFGLRKAIRISAMFSMMARRRPSVATV